MNEAESLLTGPNAYAPELHRLRGEALLLKGQPVTAEQSFVNARDVAREQEAKTLELRATVSLGRLLVSEGRDDEARPMLTGLYRWFKEGFDTADLRDAASLLRRLGADPEGT